MSHYNWPTTNCDDITGDDIASLLKVKTYATSIIMIVYFRK